MMITLLKGDCVERMSLILDDSINLVITSPPYAKQRDYNGASSNDYIEFITPLMKILMKKNKK